MSQQSFDVHYAICGWLTELCGQFLHDQVLACISIYRQSLIRIKEYVVWREQDLAHQI